MGEEEDGFLMTFVWDAGTKTSFLVVHDARALELVAEVDVEGALRVPRGVVGGGGDAEDAFGGGGGGQGGCWGWGWLKFVCNPRCLSVSLCVSLVFVGWKIGLVFRLSDGTLVCPVADLVPRCCSRVPRTSVEGMGGEY